MDAQALQELLRQRLGWRVGPHMAQYILEQLAAGATQPFPVLAADARTGRPLREMLDPGILQDVAASLANAPGDTGTQA